jgi:Leucine-rich repeat (LRR) protein
MATLNILALDDNEIESIPEDTFYDLLKLTHLSLDRNKIKVLPDLLFSKLLQLKFLFSSRNKVEALKENHFAKNPLLEHLDFANNSFQSIKVNFQKFKHFTYISFLENSCINEKFDFGGKVDLKNFQQIVRKVVIEKNRFQCFGSKLKIQFVKFSKNFV